MFGSEMGKFGTAIIVRDPNTLVRLNSDYISSRRGDGQCLSLDIFPSIVCIKSSFSSDLDTRWLKYYHIP